MSEREKRITLINASIELAQEYIDRYKPLVEAKEKELTELREQLQWAESGFEKGQNDEKRHR